jgi:hypothetical protein
MLPSHRAVQALVLFGGVAALRASPSCGSKAGEDAGRTEDDMSLLQSLIEPDFVRPQVRQFDPELEKQLEKQLTAKHPELEKQLQEQLTARHNVEKQLTAVEKPKKNTTTLKPVVKGTKIKTNAAGDLPLFLAAIRFDFALVMLFLVSFLILQRYYPIMYSYRRGDWDFESNPPEYRDPASWFGWFTAAQALSYEEIQDKAGLDARMLVRFVDMALEFTLVLGLPFCLIGIPIYFKLGGGYAKQDRLSWAGIGNVIFNGTATGLPLSPTEAAQIPSVQWIYWAVAFSVWLVVIYVQRRLFTEQRAFIDLREHWLMNMTEPRCKTVLVTGIPAPLETDPDGTPSIELDDKNFANYMEDLFPDAIESSYVVKDISSTNIRALLAEYKELDLDVKRLTNELKNEETKDDDPMMNQAVQRDLKQQKLTATTNLTAKHNEIQQAQQGFLSAPVYTCNAFVTFKTKRAAERALNVRMSRSDEEWVFEVPPGPEDIRYHDLEVDANRADFEQKLGYAAVIALIFAFMPIVVGISNLALLIARSPLISSMLKASGFEATVKGVLSTVGLTFMMAMLPTFLGMIFRAFFTLKADRWVQLIMQEYYFWFLVLFVLLVTAIGTNLAETASTLAKSPLSALRLLADKLPATTHFYLAYCMLQPVTHAMNLTRYFYVLKFWIFKRMYDIKTAKELAEPEDQDYYGMGSRSARFTLILSIGLVFGSICPLMYIPVALNFLACRAVYTYLLCFAEGRKIDQGGPHWCKQLLHIHCSLLIYLTMMTGITLHRAESKVPGIVTGVSFLWWFISFRKYKLHLHWETLPYLKLTRMEKEIHQGLASPPKTYGKYYQEELTDDYLNELKPQIPKELFLSTPDSKRSCWDGCLPKKTAGA